MIPTNLTALSLKPKGNDALEMTWRLFASTVPEIAVPCPDDLNLTDTTVGDYLKRIERHAALYQELLKIDQDTAWLSVAAMSADRCERAADHDKVG